jgi:hypothetical protein
MLPHGAEALRMLVSFGIIQSIDESHSEEEVYQLVTKQFGKPTVIKEAPWNEARFLSLMEGIDYF